MDVTITLKGDLHFNERARKLIADGLAHPGSSKPLDDMFRQWVDFYAYFTRRRFMELSRSGGGGEWPPLKLSTILGRRPFAKGQGARKISAKRKGMREMIRAAATSGADLSGMASILFDTGQLFGTLTIGAEGNVSERQGPGISFGIGGSAAHFDEKQHSAAKARGGEAAGGKKGAVAATQRYHGNMRQQVTLGQLAAYHQHGGGHLPQRQILVKPPGGDAMYGRMQRAGNAAVKKVLEQAKAQGQSGL